MVAKQNKKKPNPKLIDVLNRKVGESPKNVELREKGEEEMHHMCKAWGSLRPPSLRHQLQVQGAPKRSPVSIVW